MIEAYMGVDLNNPLAVKYNELSVKSFECVSDVLNINVIQCITPDTLFPHLTLSKHKDRSPQEIAHIHSTFRLELLVANVCGLWSMMHI